MWIILGKSHIKRDVFYGKIVYRVSTVFAVNVYLFLCYAEGVSFDYIPILGAAMAGVHIDTDKLRSSAYSVEEVHSLVHYVGTKFQGVRGISDKNLFGDSDEAKELFALLEDKHDETMRQVKDVIDDLDAMHKDIKRTAIAFVACDEKNAREI